MPRWPHFWPHLLPVIADISCSREDKPKNEFPERCNMGMVGLERVTEAEEKEELAAIIKEHLDYTGSVVAESMLSNWDGNVKDFVKVSSYTTLSCFAFLSYHTVARHIMHIYLI